MATYILTGGDDVVTGTSGADVFDGTDFDGTPGQAGGTDVLNGGGGNDIFRLDGEPAGAIDGGAGVDRLMLYHGDLGYGLGTMTFSNVEVLDLANAAPKVFLNATIAQLSAFSTITTATTDIVLEVVLTGAGGVIDFSTRATKAVDVIGMTTSGYTLTATNYADILTGSRFNDTLNGGGGEDKLYSSDGTDTLDGGAGNDLFFLWDYNFAGKIIGGAGTDTVQLLFDGSNTFGSASFGTVEVLDTFRASDIYATAAQLSAFATITNSIFPRHQFEFRLVGAGGTIDFSTRVTAKDHSIMLSNTGVTSGYSVTGSKNGDVLGGSGFNDTLNGGGGNDRLTGWGGNDTYVTDGGDTIVELAGQGTDTVQSSATYALGADLENLTLTGNAVVNGTGNTLANTITGNAAANVLNGVTGTDRLVGGLGNDIYVTDGGDTIVELANQGTDTVLSSVTYALGATLENLTLTGSAAIRGTGNTLANTITGNAAANLLNGVTGVDRLVGGLGDDTYVTDGGDTIVEGLNQGIDTVQSSVTHTLAANVDNLTLTGKAANGTGNSLSNTIIGTGAANVLNGVSGIDRLVGGLGNDTYVTDGGDTIVEAANQGTETVQSSATYTLAANLENLTLTGVTAINGIGNTLANAINGNAAANILDGGSGADRLAGGLGIDLLIGGLGNDAFVFNSAPNAATNRDIITDFSNTATNNDLFQLDNAIFTKLGAATGPMSSAFFKLSTQVQDATDYIIYNQATGALFYDANGSAAGGAIQFATLLTTPTLTAADFVVI